MKGTITNPEKDYRVTKLTVATDAYYTAIDSLGKAPQKFRKKPVIIEAILWTGNNLKEVIKFTGLHPSAEKWTWEKYEGIVKNDGLKIFTLEGTMRADIGDWIIRGVKGEFYPCKPDIFEQTYESI